MPTREELMNIIDSSRKDEFTKGEVKSYINSVKMLEAVAPTSFRKGDVIANGVGAKKRPIVIVSVVGDVMYGIPLSTTQDCMNLCEASSRFFGSQYFSKGLSAVTVDYAKDNFLGVYDNPKSLNQAIELMKQEINKL